MATWKKVIVSGSNAELNQLSIGTNLITTSSLDTNLSGAFSGSFRGNGSGLTDISAASLRNGFMTASVSPTGNRFTIQSGSTNIFTINGANGVSLYGEVTNQALGTGSLASGYASLAEGTGSVAQGFSTYAGGNYSHAEGELTRTFGSASHAEGSGSIAIGKASHAGGIGTIASGSGQTVVGKYNTRGNASTGSFIIGNGHSDTQRSDSAIFDSASIVFNLPLTASVISGSFVGDASGLTGVKATRLETGSVTASIDNNPAAGGYRFDLSDNNNSYFRIWGNGGITSGVSTGIATTGGKVYNRAEGSGSYASGSYSYAGGIGTVTNNNTDGQFAVGKFNVDTANALFVIGNGTNGASRSNLAVFNSESIQFNKVVSGSVFSGSFVGDASGLTGIATTLKFQAENGATGSINLSSSIFNISGSTNQIYTSGSGETLTIGLTNDVTISRDLTVTRNLTVLGTASFQHTDNLEVADRFILLASGSNTTGDGGLVIQQANQNVGELFGYDSNTNRWGVTSSFDASQPSYVPTAYMTTTEVGTSLPVSPTYGGGSNGFGNIFVNSTTGDIFIYS